MNVKRFSSPILQKAWIPYFILIFTLLVSLFTMYLAGLETRENDNLRFTNIVERTHGTLSYQMDTYITLLEGTTGLFSASENVTRDEFNVYVDRLNLRRQYPGIQGIGYVKRFPANELSSVTEQSRAEGLATFTVWPQVGQSTYNAILYIEPLDRRNLTALGFDMATEPIRREAMEKAAATGQPAMSGKLTLVQEIDRDKQAGFLIYLPLYAGGVKPPTVQEREALLQGFVYSPFRADDLLRGILGVEKSPQIDLRVYDSSVSAGALLHDSRNFGPVRARGYSPRFERQEQLTIAGHKWTIVYSSNQAFDAASDIWLVPFVFIFGILTSGVLFILSRAQYEAGRKAEISESNLHYIAEAGKVLGSSLNYTKTLNDIAQMGIGHMADWCSVDLKRERDIEQIAIAHKEPEQVKWAKKYRQLNPPDMSQKSGLAAVMRTGKTEFYPEITDEMIVAAAQTEDDLALARKLHITSAIIVPLKVHRRTIGAMTFISTNPKRKYSATDVSVAEEIAQRAAMAIDHAKLFAESEQAVKIRDDFISVASHELKTPVTSLKMYLQVIQKKLELKGEREMALSMKKMDAQVSKLTLLISDLLNVSRLKLGRLDFKDEYFDLATEVHDVVESLQPTTKKHTIHITGSITKKVFGDRDRIGQVITNLLTNAIKYSPDAKKVDVILSETKDEALVQVKDYGIGIDTTHAKKIFDRFYRVSDPDEKTFPGLGIGLYISHEIVSRHGGKLSVESAKGEGSTFIITLPFTKKT